MIERLRGIFVNETMEKLDEIEHSISDTSFADISKEIVADIFSTAHNIKGTAPMVGVNGLSNVVIPLEKVFRAVKDGKLSLSNDILESTKKIIPVIKAGLKEETIIEERQADTADLILFFNSLI